MDYRSQHAMRTRVTALAEQLVDTGTDADVNVVLSAFAFASAVMARFIAHSTGTDVADVGELFVSGFWQNLEPHQVGSAPELTH